MNTETTTKNEENVKKEFNSLMRKTKAQLIEIILRKDSVEKTLRENIKENKEYIEKQEEHIKSLNSSNDNLSKIASNAKSEYEDICDSYATSKIEVENIIRSKNRIITVLLFILIVTFILMFIF